MKYVPLADCEYSWYFSNPPVHDEDLKNIRPFTEPYGKQFWSEHISAEKHLILVSREELGEQFSLQEMDYNFMDDWNKKNSKALGDALEKQVELPGDELVVFFWDRSTGLETTWHVFVHNWINFLYEDEAPILLCPRTNFAMLFGPQGNILTGHKTA